MKISMFDIGKQNQSVEFSWVRHVLQPALQSTRTRGIVAKLVFNTVLWEDLMSASYLVLTAVL